MKHHFARVLGVVVCMWLIFSENSCTRDAHHLMLDHQSSFTLPAGSTLLAADESQVAFFRENFGPEEVNTLVLYKVIKKNDERMFINIILNLPVDSLRKKMLNSSKVKLLSEKTNPRGFDLFQQFDSVHFACHSIREFETGNKFIFTRIGTVRDSIEHFFDISGFDNYIVKNH